MGVKLFDKSIDKVRSDYNAIAEHYAQTRRRQNIIELSFQKVKPFLTSDMQVLDLGCGSGKMYSFLESCNIAFTYKGVDLSEKIVEEAKKLFPQGRFTTGNMVEPQEKDHYDLVSMVASFHHLPDRDARMECLKNAYASLKPRGVLFMTNWNMWQKRFWKHLPENLVRFIKSRGEVSVKDFFIPWKNADGMEVIKRYYHAFTLRELKELAKEIGFTVLENSYTKGNKTDTIFLAQNIVTILKKTNEPTAAS